MNLTHSRIPLNEPWASMNEEHLAKVNSNSKSKEKIQLSKWREQACFWRQNNNYHRKWREQACFSMFSRWRQISNTPTACVTSAEMALGLRQTSHSAGHWRFLPLFLFLWLLVQIFFQRPLGILTSSMANWAQATASLSANTPHTV